MPEKPIIEQDETFYEIARRIANEIEAHFVEAGVDLPLTGESEIDDLLGSLDGYSQTMDDLLGTVEDLLYEKEIIGS